MIVASAIARTLGKESLGILDSSFAFVNLFAGIAGLGLPRIITREICTNNTDLTGKIGTNLAITFCSCLACFLLINCLYWNSPITEKLAVAAASFLLLLQPFAYLASSILESQGRLDIVGKSLFLGLLISTISKLLIVYLKLPIYYVSLTYFIDILVTTTTAWITIKSLNYSIKIRFHYNHAIAIKLLRESLPLLLSALAAFMYSSMDILMLRWMSGLEETGLYGAAIRISQIPLFLPGILTGVYTAKLMASRNTTGNFANADLTMLARILVGFGFLILVSGWLLGPFAVKILYGESFSEAGSLLQIHVIGVFFMFIGSMRNHLLVLEGRGKLILLSDVCGAIMNLALNLWLIPKHGAMGASVATAISYFTAFFLINVIHPDLRKYNRLLYTAFKNNVRFSHK